MEENKRVLDFLKLIKEDDLGIGFRELEKNGIKFFVCYIPEITGTELLSKYIIKPLLESKEEDITISKIYRSIVLVHNASIKSDISEAMEYMLKGYSIIFSIEEEEYIICNTKEVEKRAISGPKLQDGLKVPRDAFTENMDTNISLIRYRVKDASLRIKKTEVGRRTKTEVALVYLDGVVDPKYVNKLSRKLEEIDIDGVFEEGYIQKLLSDKKFNLFPTMSLAERSDKASASILEGAVCILIEGSGISLIVPSTFVDFFDAGDDHYQQSYMSVLLKIIRYISVMINLGASAFYVCIVGYNSDIMPFKYILTLSYSRNYVPVSAFLEASIMELIVHILVEASLRLPKAVGPAVGIVGTIVIGQAAVAAGLVSPLMVIIVSLSTMSSFALPDYSFMEPIIILKFCLIILSGIVGLYGYIIGITLILIKMISQDSLGVPYGAPIAPFNLKETFKFLLSDVKMFKYRKSYLRPQNKKRKNSN
ncbi:spore germination protein [Hathewaya massiliensis]|uniref:spore germination protein n=1 Tax=Hathewaya massiliensis TaxID=1964382 RepID=UPI00115ADBFD|nr:spore germination protein [Hathewaya massiliensis]